MARPFLFHPFNSISMKTQPVTINLILIVLFGAIAANSLFSQALPCPEADKINDEIRAHNAEYERIKSDLENGLFCSECKRSKTEIENQEPVSFEQHVVDVKGQVLHATKEMLDKAYAKYMDKYNRLKGRFDSAKTRCVDEAKREQERKRKEEERKRQEAQRLAEEEAKKRQEEAKVAQEKKKQEAEAAEQKKKEEEVAKLRAEEEKRLEQERIANEMAERAEQSRIAYEQQMAEARRELQGLLGEMEENRRNNYEQILNDIKQSLSKYSNMAIGYAGEVWDATKTGISAMVKDDISDLLENEVLDDEDFDLFETAASAASAADALRDGWSGIVDRKEVVDFFETLGFTAPLQFGQTGQLKTIEQSLGNIQDSVWEYLYEAIQSDFNIEDRSGEILKNVPKEIMRNYLNNIASGLRLGDLLLPVETGKK